MYSIKVAKKRRQGRLVRANYYLSNNSIIYNKYFGTILIGIHLL